MADEPIDCTATAFRAATCSGCGTHVVAAVDFAGGAMCLGCRRIAEGIDWESQDPIGDWHPTVGYPRELEWSVRLEVPSSASGHEWWWRCVDCGMNGPADNASHAGALSRSHSTYACPATARPRPKREPTTAEEAIQVAAHPDEYSLRAARRADMTRRYPIQAPAWPERGV